MGRVYKENKKVIDDIVKEIVSPLDKEGFDSIVFIKPYKYFTFIQTKIREKGISKDKEEEVVDAVHYRLLCLREKARNALSKEESE